MRINILILLITSLNSFAQERTITGTVSDSIGPLPGANVIVKHTSNGIQTDLDGKFSIKAKSTDTLVISFVGMKNKEVHVGDVKTIEVTLLDGPKLEDIILPVYTPYTAPIRIGRPGPSDNPPLYILDGKIINEKEVQNLNPQTIESMNVLKDSAATAVYGSKGKYGVIIITSKKALRKRAQNNEKEE